MDPSSTCRIDVCVANYVETSADGSQLFHKGDDFQLVVDRDEDHVWFEYWWMVASLCDE
jgi:hypothetical protein